MPRVPPEVRSGRVWAVTLGAWTAIAFLAAAARYSYYFDRRHIAWWHSLAYSLTDEYLWALLTPPLLAFGVAFRLDRDTWPRLPLHLGVAIVLPVLYWFPASKEEIQKSSLRQSRTLSLYASQCVSMELADTRVPNADKLLGESKLPVAVLATPDGTPVSKVENKDGKLKLGDVEKVVDTEMKSRENAVDGQLKDAKAKLAAGDKDAAVQLFQSVAQQKCLFPSKAKSAAKETLTHPETATIHGARDRPGATGLYSIDPDGNKVELWEPMASDEKNKTK